MNEFIYDNKRARFIAKYGKRYAITEDGRVLSLINGKVKELSLSFSEKKYLKVNLSLKGKQTTYRVHRLVLNAFTIPDDTTGLQIYHINMNKEDNRLCNLRWCTNKQNIEFMLRCRYKDNYGNWLENKTINSTITKYKRKFKPLKKVLSLRKKQKNKVYINMEDMIAKTSKPVSVNGVEYRSAKEAARFICEDTIITATIGTVRKEIQRYLQGKRPSWLYKGKYLIGG